jgi:hypothetical protein
VEELIVFKVLVAHVVLDLFLRVSTLIIWWKGLFFYLIIDGLAEIDGKKG